MYVFHAKSGARHIFSIFSSEDGMIYNWFVDPGKNIDGLPNTTRLYQEHKDLFDVEMSNADPDVEFMFEFPKFVDYSNKVVAKVVDAVKDIKKFIRNLNDSKKKSTLFVLQMPSPSKFLRETQLKRDFPFVVKKSTKQDEIFPALSWQSFTAKRMILHLFNSREFLQHRLLLSRYADTPLCNIENDATSFVTDITLSRRLLKSNILLWAPGSTTQSPISDVINKKGFYPNICIELDIRHLAFNSIIQSTVDLESDISKPLDFSGETEEVGVSQQVFGSVKAMIKTWWTQCVQTSHPVPEMMLENFHRYIQSPQSHLHNPHLSIHLELMMKKTFSKLLNELGRLGGEIIYGNRNKIVIHTNKTNVKRAAAYGAYVIDTLNKKPEYQLLGITMRKLWSSTFWLDWNNKGGICYEIQDVIDGTPGSIVLNWGISMFLPARLQGIFMERVRSIVDAVSKINENEEMSIIDKNEMISEYITVGLKSELLKTIPKLQLDWQRGGYEDGINLKMLL